tara:strand:+ start:319 stop:744 length:426 start_codon:yes stop_codon:yes gene_type:complete
LLEYFLFLLYKKGMPKVVNKTEESSRTVERLSGLGLPHDQICAVLDISKPTLYKYYGEELIKGKAEANSQVADTLFRIATSPRASGSVTACIFWLKTQAHWKETNILEVNDNTDENNRFKELLSDLRNIKLTEKDSSKSTH